MTALEAMNLARRHGIAVSNGTAALDAAIEALNLMPAKDQLLMARLKRKKLALRDEIVKVEDRILPDIIA